MSILDLFTRPEWQQHAACRGTDTKQWFPGRGDDVRPLREMCASCPVATECLEFALQFEEGGGIWGGLTGNDRRGMRVQGFSQKHAVARCGTKSGYNRHRNAGEDPCVACREANAAANRDYNARRKGAA